MSRLIRHEDDLALLEKHATLQTQAMARPMPSSSYERRLPVLHAARALAPPLNLLLSPAQPRPNPLQHPAHQQRQKESGRTRILPSRRCSMLS